MKLIRVRGRAKHALVDTNVSVSLNSHVDTALHALAEPRRRAILNIVRDGEKAAGEIAAYFDVTRSAISQHLKVLKDAGLLEERRDGTRRIYRARREGLREVREYLETFWSGRLQGLKRVAEQEERRQRV